MKAATPAILPSATVYELATYLKLSAYATQILKDEELQTVKHVEIFFEVRNFPGN